ncbi:MAG: molecular chaperone TorD family protein [Desulfobacula sp.]|nr:molecular chaperone TorD family protein [Desulfobacula sp.]
MDIEHIVSYEKTRQDIYEIFANCYRLPKKSIAEKLNTLSDHLLYLDSKAAQYINYMQTGLDQNFEMLTIEFSRLFIGPYSLPTPPYGSVYIEKERKVMGDSSMDAKKRYQHCGLDISDDIQEVPDHIAIELEFMFCLIFKEIESIRTNLPEQTQETLYHQESFLTDHLNRWIPDFADAVIEHSKIEYYRNLAKATRIFISEDLEYLKTISIPVMKV